MKSIRVRPDTVIQRCPESDCSGRTPAHVEAVDVVVLKGDAGLITVQLVWVGWDDFDLRANSKLFHQVYKTIYEINYFHGWQLVMTAVLHSIQEQYHI